MSRVIDQIEFHDSTVEFVLEQDGLLMAPLVASGAVTGIFEFVDSSPMIVTGTAIQVDLIGSPTLCRGLAG
jgi:hypothetical protein